MAKTAQSLADPGLMLGPETTVMEAGEMMLERDVNTVVVVDAGRRLLGIFSERDQVVRVLLSGADPATTPLQHVMSENVLTLPHDADMKQILDALMRCRFRTLPVLDAQGRVVGVLSSAELLKGEIARLGVEVDALESFLSVDGPGG